MVDLLLAALGLGVAGLDPAGALIAAGALGGGARERDVAAYGLVTLLGTVAFGAALSLAIGPSITSFDWRVLVPGGWTGAILDIVLGLGLVAWGVARIRRPATRAPKPRSSRGTGFAALVAAYSVWVLVSQAPLVALLAAMAGGRHERFVVWFRSWWTKIRPAIGRLATGILLLAGTIFLVDAGWWLATGEFLLPG